MPTPEQILTALPDEHVLRMLDVTDRPYYWLDSVLADDADDRDGIVLRGTDTVDESPVQLTFDQVRTAYVALLDLDQQLVNDTLHGYVIDSWRHRLEGNPDNQWDLPGQVDLGYVDSDALDAIIQVAAFGKPIYG